MYAFFSASSCSFLRRSASRSAASLASRSAFSLAAYQYMCFDTYMPYEGAFNETCEIQTFSSASCRRRAASLSAASRSANSFASRSAFS